MTGKMPWHGTAGGYVNHRCRCDECTTAWKEHNRRQRASRVARAPREAPHGTRSAYINWGCRCDRCRLAMGIIPSRLKSRPGPSSSP